MESGKNRAASREKASRGQPQHRLGNNLTKRAQSHCTRARQAGTAIARHPTDSSDKKQSNNWANPKKKSRTSTPTA